MCYSRCRYENNSGGCAKPVNKICPSELIQVCNREDKEECYHYSRTLDVCESDKDCKHKTIERD